MSKLKINFKKHTPVMCSEVLKVLNINNEGVYIDATFGQGGYTTAILEKFNCKIIAIDRDDNAEVFAKKIKKKHPKNFIFNKEKFSDLDKVLHKNKIKKVDGIMFDLGISNTQLDSPERGFSFKINGPLDMRMDQTESINAEHIVNHMSEEELSEIFFRFGDEKNSRKIGKEIINRRKTEKILSTRQLSELINKVNFKTKKSKIDPSTRVFQALRIYVNKEIEELEKALIKCLKELKKNGRIVVVSFHSIEDRVVKKFFRKYSGYKIGNYKHLPEQINDKDKPRLKIITKKALIPSDEEIRYNPRSRSAKLRVAELL